MGAAVEVGAPGTADGEGAARSGRHRPHRSGHRQPFLQIAVQGKRPNWPSSFLSSNALCDRRTTPARRNRASGSVPRAHRAQEIPHAHAPANGAGRPPKAPHTGFRASKSIGEHGRHSSRPGWHSRRCAPSAGQRGVTDHQNAPGVRRIAISSCSISGRGLPAVSSAVREPSNTPRSCIASAGPLQIHGRFCPWPWPAGAPASRSAPSSGSTPSNRPRSSRWRRSGSGNAHGVQVFFRRHIRCGMGQRLGSAMPIT